MLVIATAPAAEPLTPAEVRARLGLDSSVTDDQLNPLILLARQEIDGKDGWLRRAIITQTWDLKLDCFEPRIRIPLPPLQTVVSVKHLDTAGVEQTDDPSTYRVVPGDPFSHVETVSAWPATKVIGNAVTIRFTAGYGNAGSHVPEPLRMGMVLRIGVMRSMLRPDMLLRSETVEGIGSRTFAVGEGADSGVNKAIFNLFWPYWVPEVEL